MTKMRNIDLWQIAYNMHEDGKRPEDIKLEALMMQWKIDEDEADLIRAELENMCLDDERYHEYCAARSRKK